MATIITSHIATKRPALPAHVSPGIAIQTIARVQPPGMAIPPAMERDQWTVAAALARNSSAPAARSDSVLVAVVVAHPALYVIGIFVAALGHQVEHVVRAVQRLDAASVARIRVEHRAGPVLVEHARAFAIGHSRVRRPDIVEQGATLELLRRERHAQVVVEVGAGGRDPLEAPAHASLVALDLVEGRARHGHEADVAVGQVQAGAVVMVGPEGAAWASFLVLRSEHEMIDEQLALRAEQLGEGLFAVRALEHVRLVEPLPGERAGPPGQLVLGKCALLLVGGQRGVQAREGAGARRAGVAPRPRPGTLAAPAGRAVARGGALAGASAGLLGCATRRARGVAAR